MKLDNDKYYTPKHIVKHCVDKTFEVIGKENITEIIDSSAGDGAFLEYSDVSYDLYPEHKDIIQQDFTTLKLPYKKGRLIGWNPPFGSRNSLIKKFMKQSSNFGDYIAMILPNGYYNNRDIFYKWDLVYSEDLGDIEYSNSYKVPTCFNIWVRANNPKPDYRLKGVYVSHHLRGGKTNLENVDYRFCAWGSVGKETKVPDRWCKEMIINFEDKSLIEKARKINWIDYATKTSAPSITCSRVLKALKENIPELEYDKPETLFEEFRLCSGIKNTKYSI